MSSLDSLKIGTLREINSLLGLSNRRSKDENITQIVSHMVNIYRYRGPYTEELIRERVEKGIPSTPEGDLNAIVDSDRLNTTLIENGIVSENELGNDNVTTLNRLESAIINGRVRTHQIVSSSSSSSESESESESEEEEDPDPAVRYRVDSDSDSINELELEEESDDEPEDDIQENEYSDSDIE